MPVNQGGIGKVGYPLIADIDKSIGRSYDVLLGTTPATVLTEDVHRGLSGPGERLVCGEGAWG